MPSEGIEGHEWGTYVVLDTFLRDGTWDGLRGASLKGTECQEDSWESCPTRGHGRAVHKGKWHRWLESQEL